MSHWERLADLPLLIEAYSLERLSMDVSSGMTRVSTVVRLRGSAAEGLGEDVTYETPDQEAQLARGADLPLAGRWTLGSFCAHLEQDVDLWPTPPAREPSRNYRIWAYESAALDLALRQAGTSLGGALGLEPRPMRFVVSLRLGEPPSVAPLQARLDLAPSLQFKLDPTQDWDDELVAAVAATGAVESLDLKGQYKGSPVDVGVDRALYERLLAAFPDAWLEDPHTDPAVADLVEAHRDRVTWDAVLHSLDDVRALARQPTAINVKPSRFGPLRELLAVYEHCDAHGIAMYSGGQFELGIGRGQIQHLAALFHPDGPNDAAPGGWNATAPDPGLPTSPLPVTGASSSGFRGL